MKGNANGYFCSTGKVDGKFTYPYAAKDQIWAYNSSYMRVKPELGFLGIECGVSGSCSLRVVGSTHAQVNVVWNIPAVGDQFLTVNSSHKKAFTANVVYRGKSDQFNSHNYVVSIDQDRQLPIILQNEDAGLAFFEQVGIKLVDTAIDGAKSAALGAALVE